jgi:hypothetical protein
VAHAAADLDLERLGLRLLDLAREVCEHFLGAVVALAVGAVNMNDRRVYLVADQQTERLVRDTPEQVEDREFDRRERHPEREALQLVIALVNIRILHDGLEVARVFADEERLNPVHVNRIQRSHLRVVRNRDALGAILRTDATEKVVLQFQQLERLDDDRRGEQLATEDGPLQHRVEFRVSGFNLVGPDRSSMRTKRKRSRGATGDGCGEEIATTRVHGGVT